MKIVDENVIRFVQKNVFENPEKDAFIYLDEKGEYQKMTNKDFFEKVLKFASILKNKKFKKSDRVIIFLPMSVELYIILVGMQVVGVVPVFLESWSKIQHIKNSIKNAEPKGIISLLKLFQKYGFFFRNFDFSMALNSDFKKGKVLSFKEEIKKELNNEIEIMEVAENDTALITYTTGSSGVPKGADRTHKFLSAQHLALKEIFPYEKNDIDLPVFPVFALNNLASGVTTVIPEIMSADNLEDKDIKKLVEQIKKIKINNLTLSPIIFNKLTSYAQKNNLIFPEIKRVLTGGAPVSENDVSEFKKVVPNAKIWILYGSTEVEPISYIEAEEMIKIMQNLKYAKNRTHQGVVVGKIHKDLEYAFIKVDFDDWKTDEIKNISVKNGEVGELVVSGKHVSERYYKNEEAFKKAKIVDRNKKVWHRTGDIGRLDDENNLWIVGRKHNLILKNNEIYFPVRPEILLKEISRKETAAYLQIRNDKEEKIYIVLEGIKGKKLEKEIEKEFLKEKIPFDEIIFVPKIIMDIRHHSKVDYSAMREIIKKRTGILKWKTFLKERFCLLEILSMTAVFVFAHFVVLNNEISLSLKNIFLVIILVLFFFKLRLYDEIKDFETDKIKHKERPLPTGMMKVSELKKVIFGIIILELAFFGSFGLKSFALISLTVFYSLLMFKEFFVRDWIRKYLTFYAVSHTFIVSLFSLTLFSTFIDLNKKEVWFFSLASWFIFSVFEFGRKTFALKEEKKEIDSYSKNFGLRGAVLLNGISLFLGLYLIYLSFKKVFIPAEIIFGIFLLISALFLWKENLSKIYRFYSTALIFLIYLSILIF